MSTLPNAPAERKPGFVFLTIRIDPQKRKQLKVLAADRGTTITAILTAAVRRYLQEEWGARPHVNGGAPE